MTSLYDLGLNFRDCQLIEAYLNLERCDLKYQRAVLVYDDLYKKTQEVHNSVVEPYHQEALIVAQERIKLAEESLKEANKELEKFVKEERRNHNHGERTF